MDEFREELRLRGVELNEVRKVDKETGEETVGWSYKAHDPLGKTKRKRRRRASNLADDLTKEGVEAYFEEKQRQSGGPEGRRAGTCSSGNRRGGTADGFSCRAFIRRVLGRGVRCGADGGRPPEGTHRP